MNLNEMLKATGRLTVQRINSAGDVVETLDIPNLVVSVGKTYIASRMTGASASVMSHMAIGSDQTAAVVGNTTLGTELGRVSLTDRKSVV